MKVPVIFFSLFSIVFCQPGDFIPGYEEITSSTTSGSIGALGKCGEGTDQGAHACVPYYNCDGNTNLIVQDGIYDGRGLISLRSGFAGCEHYLDVCCGIPAQDIQRDPGEDDTPPTSKPPIRKTTQRVRTTTPALLLECGIRNYFGLDFQITGNSDNEAEYGEFPWMVAILRAGSGQNLAGGGSILSPNVVLTGAHIVNLHKTTDFKVRAGEWDTQTTRERLPYQERFISRIIIHEDFNEKVMFNNVALMILERPFNMDVHIRPICLPRQAEVINSRHCFVTGWGKDVFGKAGKYQVILKKFEMSIVPHGKCQNELRKTRLGSRFKLHNSFLCAGGEPGIDACTGDGGGPLVCSDPHNPSRYVQAGIVTYGIGCGQANVPGVYADVAKFRNWIDENLRRLNIDSSIYA